MGDALAGTRTPPTLFTFNRERWGDALSTRAIAVLMEFTSENMGEPARKKQVGESTTTSVPDAVVAVRITEVISRL